MGVFRNENATALLFPDTQQQGNTLTDLNFLTAAESADSAAFFVPDQPAPELALNRRRLAL